MRVTNCWTSYPTWFILVNDWGWLSKMVRLLVSLVLWLHTCNYNVTTDSVPSICKAYNVHFAFQPKVRYKTVYIPWGSSPASCQWVCGWGCCEQLKDWPSSTAPLYPWETETQRERTVSGQTQDRVQNSQQPTIVIGSHPALDTWWCYNKSGFYPDSIKLQRVFILTERITADEPLFNVGLNILRNIWRQLVF